MGWIFAQSTKEREFIMSTEEICQMAAMQVQPGLCNAGAGSDSLSRVMLALDGSVGGAGNVGWCMLELLIRDEQNTPEAAVTCHSAMAGYWGG